MSDRINSCTVYKTPEGKISYYSVNFTFDIFVPEGWENVDIMVYELSDPTDLNSVRLLALKKAKGVKDFVSNSTVITDLNGSVSL